MKLESSTCISEGKGYLQKCEAGQLSTGPSSLKKYYTSALENTSKHHAILYTRQGQGFFLLFFSFVFLAITQVLRTRFGT